MQWHANANETYAHAISQIAKQRQQEEEQRQALAGLLAPILVDLREAGAKVADGTGVAQDLSARSNVLGASTRVNRRGSPDSCCVCDSPADGTCKADAQDAEDVLPPLAGRILLLGNTRQRIDVALAVSAAGGDAGAAARTGQTEIVAVAAAQERLLNAVARRSLRHLALATSVSNIVVQALGNQDQIGKAEVHGKGDDGRHETSPGGAGEVGDIANEPDGEKCD